MGRIPPEYLPPPEAWQERVYTLPELRAYPQRLNSAEEILDRHVAEGRGDRAAILFEKSYVTFLSREDDLIKSSGYRIGPEEIESVIARHLAVADCCVIGVPDAVRGQNTRASVTLRQSSARREGLEQETVDSCHDALPAYKLRRKAVFVDSVPCAPGPAGPGTGKLLRRVLRAAAV